jgi:hypothetical protein
MHLESDKETIAYHFPNAKFKRKKQERRKPDGNGVPAA